MSSKLMFYLFGLGIGLFIYFTVVRPKETTPVGGPAVTNTLPANLNLRFDCTSIGTEDTPQTIVHFTINGKNWALDTVSQAKILEQSEIQQHKMPTNTLSACGGWWAGAGDYFYAVREGETIQLYHGWQEETQSDDGYHYQKIKTIGKGDL